MQWNDEMNNELMKPWKGKIRVWNTSNSRVHWNMSKWIMKSWNEQWNDEKPRRVSKSVKHTKWPSALAYDEIHIHVKKGE